MKRALVLVAVACAVLTPTAASATNPLDVVTPETPAVAGNPFPIVVEVRECHHLPVSVILRVGEREENYCV